MSTTALSNFQGIKLLVTGMPCASCVMRVETTLKAVPGVKEATVSDDASVSAASLTAAVRKAGYSVATTATALGFEGMTYTARVSQVDKALAKVPAVTGASVNLATEKATVRALTTVPVAALKAVVEKTGYTAQEILETKAQARPGLPAWCTA